jgi:predicted GNAT superfamily acetyltransferase
MTNLIPLGSPRHLPDLLALNAASEVETSPLDELALQRLLDLACLAFGIEAGGRIEAFMVALDQSAPYDNFNFAWFKARYPTFVYIDRVITAAHARGRGHGRRLYTHLFQAAKAAGHGRVVCEVNRSPPNPGSDAFHRALGFSEVGEAALPNGKVVRYLQAELGGREA